MFSVSPDTFISVMVVDKFVENMFVIHDLHKSNMTNHLFSAGRYLPQQPNAKSIFGDA